MLTEHPSSQHPIRTDRKGAAHLHPLIRALIAPSPMPSDAGLGLGLGLRDGLISVLGARASSFVGKRGSCILGMAWMGMGKKG